MSFDDGESHAFTVPPESAGERLDKFLHGQIPTLTRTQIQVLIKGGQVTDENGEKLWHKNHATRAGDRLNVRIPTPKPSVMLPYEVALDILYEDEHLLVLNKPAGMTVHPGAGTGPDTLVHALLAHCGDSLSGIGGVARPGLIHRIDRDTTGLLVVAKNDRAHLSLSAQLKKREISRGYIAICWGKPSPARGRIETYIGRSLRDRRKMAIYATPAKGKLAITNYAVERELADGGASLVRFKLETGRTHQIRIHAAHAKFPLVGDKTYGGTPPGSAVKHMSTAQKEAALGFPRQALHAETLAFIHPVSLKLLNFNADLPDDFETLLETLETCPT